MKSWVAIGSVLVLLLSEVHAAESTCYGTTSKGRVENAVPLPSEGRNFVSYGSFPELAGRTYVHSKVHDVVADAYRLLEAEQPCLLDKDRVLLTLFRSSVSYQYPFTACGDVNYNNANVL